MNNFFPFALFIVTVLFSCKGQQVSLEKEGKLEGVIGIFEGNCMPGPGVDPCKPKPIATTIYITQPARDFKEELLVTSFQSSKNGNYSIKLMAGTYSLFLKDENSIICDGMSCPEECYCHPFTITADSTTVIDANLNHAVW